MQESYKGKWVMGQVTSQVTGQVTEYMMSGDKRRKSQVMKSGKQGHSMWPSGYSGCVVVYLTIVTLSVDGSHRPHFWCCMCLSLMSGLTAQSLPISLLL